MGQPARVPTIAGSRAKMNNLFGTEIYKACQPKPFMEEGVVWVAGSIYTHWSTFVRLIKETSLDACLPLAEQTVLAVGGC